MINYSLRYKKWLEYTALDEELKIELEKIKGNESEIEERFGRDLKFGTAGLRGLMGAGINRMNIYTVRKTTLGLAQYFLRTDENKKNVVIAYDSRFKSKKFANEVAMVLANNNIKVYLFNDITPTPLLSYAVRYLNSIAGIVITASHNPKEYNGYKVYGSDGGQITDKIANGILTEIEKISDDFDVKQIDFEKAFLQKKVEYVPNKLIDDYLEKVKGICLNRKLINEYGKILRIVYTPLHGTGNVPVRRVLNESGFSDILIPAEQEKPDGGFPTVKYPNPEEKEALSLAINLAKETVADIVIATDPDADRVGVAVPEENDDFQILSGNQLGILLLDYILRNKHKNNLLDGKEIMIKTIVTSEMGRSVAAKYGVETIDVLTGFKYIGEKIKEFEMGNKKKFIFGFEESNGYLVGDFVRDKDAVQASLVIAEMALFYKKQNKSLLVRLEELYYEFGYFAEEVLSLNFQGQEGETNIKKIMDFFRQKYPQEINEKKVIEIRDYSTGKIRDIIANNLISTNLPLANVIYIILENKTWICIRPSGTEPKLKIYFGAVSTNLENVKKETINLIKYFQNIILNICK